MNLNVLLRHSGVVLLLALVLAGCGTEATIEDPPSAPDIPDGLDIAFVLPAVPSLEELEKPSPVGDVGVDVPNDVFGTQVFVWCDALDLNPREDAPDAEGVFMLVVPEDPGDGDGAVTMQFDAAKFSAGDVVDLPTESWDFVLFMFYLHDEFNVPREYNSDQEESSGTITLHEVPCQGSGDTLSFTVDGFLGAETNAGYLAAIQANGTFRASVTEPPPDF